MKKCPNCGKILTDEMINVNMCWECGFILDPSQADMDEDVIELQMSELKKKTYARSVGKSVEYGVDAVITTEDGYTDIKEIERILNDRAYNGWRLVSSYSNTLGVNAIRVMGFGSNSTVSQAILIFERELKKESPD